jgi:hypothetical protein
MLTSASAMPEDELVAILLGVSRRTARWLLWLRWRYLEGRIGGERDGLWW